MRFLRGRLRRPRPVMNEPATDTVTPSAAHPAAHALTLSDFNFDPPSFSLQRLQELAAKRFGITGRFSRLEGERDQNCRITTADGQSFVLKVSSVGEDPSVVDFQVQALMHIAGRDATLPVPRMVRGRDGEVVYRVSGDKGLHMVRMLTWLEGMRYQDGLTPSLRGMREVGGFLARLCLALQGFSHPAQRHFMAWDITNGLLFRPQMLELLPPGLRERMAAVLARLEHETYPALAGLRSQVIHQDGHGANLLRRSAESEEVAGLIDFGDMIHAPLICDLAASLSDFVGHADGPLAIAGALTEGFHAVNPLYPAETDLLLDLVIARQILILELFEFRRRHMRSPPAFVTDDQPAIMANLEMLTALDREAFNRGLRNVCR